MSWNTMRGAANQMAMTSGSSRPKSTSRATSSMMPSCAACSGVVAPPSTPNMPTPVTMELTNTMAIVPTR
jgi:hypothetical protein